MAHSNKLVQVVFFAFVAGYSSSYVEAQASLWAVGSTEKVRALERRSKIQHPVWNEETNTVVVKGARGEHVPFQLVVTAEAHPIKDVTFTVSDLHNANALLQHSQIELFLEYHVDVYATTDVRQATGLWPDALVPLTNPFTVGSPRDGRFPYHQPIWVDIVIPGNQPPGEYKGTISAKTPDAAIGQVGIQLTVWDFKLPKQKTMWTAFGVWPAEIAEAHQVEANSDEHKKLMRRYYEFYLAKSMEPRDNIFLKPKWEKSGDKIEIDWSSIPLEDHFLTDLQTTYVWFWAEPDRQMGSSGDGGLSAEYKEVLRQYWTEVYRHYKQKGWLDKLIIECPVNEPNSKEDYDLSREWADLIHSVSPELKFFIVEPIIPQDPAWGSLVGYSQVWAIHGNHIEANRNVIRERQAEGDLIQIYLTCDQRYPQPNFFIDQDAGDHRMIPWVAYKYHVSGVRYWATNYWSHVKDPWTDIVTWKHSRCYAPLAGEGSLLYPGNLVERHTGQQNVDGPVGSVRLELLREGIEDVEYLYMLERMGEGQLARELARSLVISIRAYTNEPQRIEATREKAALKILSLIEKQ